MSRKQRTINLVIWALVSLLWAALTAAKIISKDELWLILMDGFVALLSLTNFVIHLVFWIKKR